MRIRRSTHARDLRSAPIDRLDAFLLTLLVDEMPLAELVEIAPCDEAEATQRIHTLAALGLVDVLVSPGQQRRLASRYRPNLNVHDDAVTLRPPPTLSRNARDSEGAVTLRPPQSAPLELDLADFGAPPQTGVRPCPVPSATQALAKMKILQRKA